MATFESATGVIAKTLQLNAARRIEEAEEAHKAANESRFANAERFSPSTRKQRPR